MNPLVVFLLWFGSGVAVLSMVGSFGLWNAFLLIITRNWRKHLALWLSCVMAFTACLLVFPRTLTFHESGEVTFSDERAISGWIG